MNTPKRLDPIKIPLKEDKEVAAIIYLDNKYRYVGIGIEEGSLTHQKRKDTDMDILIEKGTHKRTMKFIPPGIHKSKNKCPECGNAMEFYLEMDQDNRIDSTSSYSINYLCKVGHNFRMTLDEAIDKYGTEL